MATGAGELIASSDTSKQENQPVEQIAEKLTI